jgi:hypothetical protein
VDEAAHQSLTRPLSKVVASEQAEDATQATESRKKQTGSDNSPRIFPPCQRQIANRQLLGHSIAECGLRIVDLRIELNCFFNPQSSIRNRMPCRYNLRFSP